MDRLIEKLKKYRMKNRLSIEKLARELDVSYMTMWRWLAGKAEPNDWSKGDIKRLIGK